MRKRPAASATEALLKRPAASAAAGGHETPLERPSAASAAATLPSQLLFENERLRVSDLRLPPQTEIGIAHRWPTVRWQVGEAEHLLDGSRLAVPDRQVHFVEPGTPWRLRNVGPSLYRQVVFEILGPAHRTEEQVGQLVEAASYSVRVGTELLFENSLCRCWDFFLEPGQVLDEVHQHTLDYAFVLVAPGRLIGSHPSGEQAFDDAGDDGKVLWTYIPNGGFAGDGRVLDEARHGGRNGYDDKPFREYLIELK